MELVSDLQMVFIFARFTAGFGGYDIGAFFFVFTMLGFEPWNILTLFGFELSALGFKTRGLLCTEDDFFVAGNFLGGVTVFSGEGLCLLATGFILGFEFGFGGFFIIFGSEEMQINQQPLHDQKKMKLAACWKQRESHEEEVVFQGFEKRKE